MPFPESPGLGAPGSEGGINKNWLTRIFSLIEATGGESVEGEQGVTASRQGVTLRKLKEYLAGPMGARLGSDEHDTSICMNQHSVFDHVFASRA